ALALQDPAGLAAAGVVAGARDGVAERHTLAILAVFGGGAVLETPPVAQPHAAEIEHAVLHGGEHLLAAAGSVALIKCGDDAEREMETRAGVADLRAGNDGRAFAEARGRSGTAGALGHVLIDLAVLVGSGAEAFYGRNDHARIELVDVLPVE